MPAAIAALMDALGWLFTSRLGTWIVSAFAFLGITYGTQHVVIQPTLDQLQSLATGSMGSGSFASTAADWLGVMNFDRAVSMIIGAYTTKFAVTASRVFLQKKAA